MTTEPTSHAHRACQGLCGCDGSLPCPCRCHERYPDPCADDLDFDAPAEAFCEAIEDHRRCGALGTIQIGTIEGRSVQLARCAAHAVVLDSDDRWTDDLGEEPLAPSAALTEALGELLRSIGDMDDDERYRAGIETPIFTAARISTYAEAMLLTRDDGLVVRLTDGSEYQLTVQRSK